jgi:uncharacterized protein
MAIWQVILIGVLCIVVICYTAAILGTIRFSLHPFRIPIYLSPGAMGTPQEQVAIEGPNGLKIPGWYVPGDFPVTVIQLHGYMMNRSELVPNCKWLYDRGIGSLTVDFSAHGGSPGKSCGLGYPERMEVLACCRWVKKNFPGHRIVLIGSSMGSAASALALAEDPTCADALVLDSAYSNMEAAISGWWSMLGGKALQTILKPAGWFPHLTIGFNPAKVDVAEALTKSQVPVLVLHGKNDTLVPPHHAERNLKALGERGQVVWFEGAVHSAGRWEQPERYFQALEEFFQENALLPETVQVVH